MPYIKPEDRDQVLVTGPKNAGEIQYCIAAILQEYLNNIGNYRYQDLNDIIGALEGAKLEFYRRVVVPYENLKIGENGDVYDT